jgi:HAD superfamily hydrolase (TIGR01450 family)
MIKSERPKIVLCDLDGVIWLAHEPIEGSIAAVASLQEAGIRVLFVTNNSFSTVSEQEAHLLRLGISAVGNVMTSAMSTAAVLKPGQKALVCGGPGIVEALTARGVHCTVSHENLGTTDSFDAVVVGMYRQFSYDVLNDAQRAVRNGAMLIGANEDPTYPTPQGQLPGGGSILAAISAASGATPLVTGKPHQVMAQMVRDMCVPVGVTEMLMIGDRPSTDGKFARNLGCRFALVLSGVTSESDGKIDVQAEDLVGVNLAAVVQELLA